MFRLRIFIWQNIQRGNFQLRREDICYLQVANNRYTTSTSVKMWFLYTIKYESKLLPWPELWIDKIVLFRTLVAEGLCKLILCGAITSHKLFTRLILIWCNPVNDANTKMKTILGMFFPLYASLSRTNQVSIDSSVPTLRPKYSFWSKKTLWIWNRI